MDDIGIGDDDESLEDVVSNPFSKMYPILSSVDISLFDDQDVNEGFNLSKFNRNNLLREIVELKKMYNEPLSYESLNSKKNSLLIDVSHFKSEDDFITNLDGWMTQMFDIDGSESVIRCVLHYLKMNCPDELANELRKQQLAPKMMDKFDIAATIEHYDIEITHWRRIVHCLKMFQDVTKIGDHEGHWWALGKGHSKVEKGLFLYQKEEGDIPERIHYWWKNPVHEFSGHVSHLINGFSLDPNNIEFINNVYGGDHGKGKFRFTAKIIIKMKDNSYCERVYPVGDVKCRKDNRIVLSNTIFSHVCERVNFLYHNPSYFFCKDGEWCLSFEEDVDPYAMAMDEGKVVVTVQQNVFIAGDLAYLAVVMGKEGYEKDWCCLCDVYNTDWVDFGHDLGNMWTVESLKAQHSLNVEKNLKGKAKKGVKCNPYFDIPVENVIFSVLHALMGIGNALLAYLIDTVELNIECLLQEEIGLFNDIKLMELNLQEARDQRDDWDRLEEKGKRRLKLKARHRSDTNLMSLFFWQFSISPLL